MKKKLSITLLCLIVPGTVITLLAWGFWGHQRINQMAVFTLPPRMIGFYKKHIDFLTVHAVDPDKRRYSDPEEAPRHFMDLDRYGEHPFDSLPKYWSEAVAKFGEDSLKAHGIVGYHIPLMLARLTNAFKAHDQERILRISAEIGHYIGDAHVPLHCTRNYNGQLTGQNGIHGFWESRLPELYGEEYDYFTGQCTYIAKPVDYTWHILRASYAAHDSVLQMEHDLNKIFPADRKYAWEDKGGMLVKTYSKEYSAAYAKMMDGMVERRMRAAILAVSSFWYTAWMNAGMPDLDQLGDYVQSASMKTEMDSLDKSFEKNKLLKNIKGHDDESGGGVVK